MNPFFLVAALADLVAVFAHGYLGQRLIMDRLTNEHLFETRAFGSAEATRRVMLVTWHAVTAAFASSAAMMSLLGSGAVTSRPAALFVSALHAGILLVGLVVAGRHIFDGPLRPIPVVFVTCMATVTVMGWLGSR